MVLCPVALAVGCKRCPIFAACPVKGIIGDYKKPEPEDKPAASKTTRKSAPAKTSSAKAAPVRQRAKKRR